MQLQILHYIVAMQPTCVEDYTERARGYTVRKWYVTHTFSSWTLVTSSEYNFYSSTRSIFDDPRVSSVLSQQTT